MYEDKQSAVSLSKDCWQCLQVIQDVGYAYSYIFFWSSDLKIVQEAIRKIVQDIQGDYFKLDYEGNTVTFSLSDEAISHYRPNIQEFSSLGSAVKILGAYENYIRAIVSLSDEIIPEDMNKFKSDHEKLVRNVDGFWSHKLGRGIDFSSELFGWKPNPAYKPRLQFMFRLRNIVVHNRGIADKTLCQLANNQYVHAEGKLRVGDSVSWNFLTYLQLNSLVIRILPEVDPYISSKLGLTTIERPAFW